MRVRLVDRGFELGARDVHIGLEGIHALVGPIGDLRRASSGDVISCVLDEEGAGAFEIGAGHVQMRADADAPRRSRASG